MSQTSWIGKKCEQLQKVISKFKILDILLYIPVTLSSQVATFFKTTADSRGGTVEIRNMVLAGREESGMTFNLTGSS